VRLEGRMRPAPRASRAGRRDEAGFTLVEVMIATAVIMAGLVAVMMGFGFATTGAEAGRQQTTALFLAEQRMEAVRSVAVNLSNPNAWTDPQIAAGIAQEPYGTIPDAPSYRRTTTITDSAPPVNWKRVQVDVFYRPIAEPGAQGQERQLTLVSIVGRRQ